MTDEEWARQALCGDDGKPDPRYAAILNDPKGAGLLSHWGRFSQGQRDFVRRKAESTLEAMALMTGAAGGVKPGGTGGIQVYPNSQGPIAMPIAMAKLSEPVATCPDVVATSVTQGEAGESVTQGVQQYPPDTPSIPLRSPTFGGASTVEVDSESVTQGQTCASVTERYADTEETKETERNATGGFAAAAAVEDARETSAGGASGGNGANVTANEPAVAAEHHRFPSEKYDLPLSEFLTWAAEHVKRVRCQKVEDDTATEWGSPVFEFVRLVKGHPATAKLAAERALKVVEPHLIGWSKVTAQQRKSAFYTDEFNPLGKDPWWDWFEQERADAVADFLHLWGRISFIPGQDPLLQAAERARQLRFLLPDAIGHARAASDPRQRDESDYGFFVSLAGHLQIVRREGYIMLPCHTVAPLMEVAPKTISRYCAWAVEDQILYLVKKFPRGVRRATMYLFRLERWPKVGDMLTQMKPAQYLACPCEGVGV
jgi:hypothetical protein